MDLYTFDRIKIEEHAFHFACHKDVPCYRRCCYDADTYLYPYDIVRLKNRLGIKSNLFIERYTYITFREHPFFPSVMLKMQNTQGAPCYFLNEDGCGVYEDRPFSCRTYPLEPDIHCKQDKAKDSCFYLCRHGHCLGHHEQKQWHVDEWLVDQKAQDYYQMNVKWFKLSELFTDNPWGQAGIYSEPFKMAFMASYNIDLFKEFVFSEDFTRQFLLTQEDYAGIERSDRELLVLGMDYIEFILTGKGSLKDKEVQI